MCTPNPSKKKSTQTDTLSILKQIVYYAAVTTEDKIPLECIERIQPLHID